MCQAPYEHDHVKPFTGETPEAGWFSSFPKVTGRLPIRAQTQPQASVSPSFVIPPGLYTQGMSGPGFQFPSTCSWPMAARAGAAGRRCGGEGRGRRAQLFCWRTGKKTPLLEASPAALLVSYKLPLRSRPRPQQEGQLHCSLLRMCFMEPGRRGKFLSHPPACERRNQ